MHRTHLQFLANQSDGLRSSSLNPKDFWASLVDLLPSKHKSLTSETEIGRLLTLAMIRSRGGGEPTGDRREVRGSRHSLSLPLVTVHSWPRLIPQSDTIIWACFLLYHKLNLPSLIQICAQWSSSSTSVDVNHLQNLNARTHPNLIYQLHVKPIPISGGIDEPQIPKRYPSAKIRPTKYASRTIDVVVDRAINNCWSY